MCLPLRRFLSVIGVAAALLAIKQAAAQPIPLTRKGTSLSVIVHARDEHLSAVTAQKLATYLKTQTDVMVPIASDDKLPRVGRDTTVIVLDGTPDHRVAARFGQSIALPSDRPDGYQLKVFRPATGPSLVLAAGAGPSGAKYAAYRLMRELELQGRDASIRLFDVNAAPFLATRSVSLFNVWSMPIELTRRHNTESWPVERLERYVDMYDQFGFNAIESHDRFNDNYLEPLFGLKRSDWRAKVQRMCDRAHDNGQQFFLRIWGHVVMETPKFDRPLGPTASVPKKLAYLCVNDPAERRRWEEEILQYYVSNYAGRIDRLIGHWCDPGVCRRNGCDFRTPLQLQMELHRAFTAVDPKFTSTFSLWYFDATKNNRKAWARGGWPGYDTDLDLINADILDRDVEIAAATSLPGSYDDRVVKAIIAAGHRPAVWTWYRADHEIRPSLHVHLHERLGDYFRNLPASAHQLAWHNVERNVHGAANTASYYVAGRLMWEPESDVDEVLREFLTLACGPENAPRIAPAYLAIERIRCPVCYQNWEGARFTGAGTEDPAADLAMAQSALDRLQTVQLAADFRPRLPLDISPRQLVDDLAASLEVIRDFARCRAEELPSIDRAVAAHDQAAATRLLDELVKRFGGWNTTLSGRQEWTILDGMIKARRQALADAGR